MSESSLPSREAVRERLRQLVHEITGVALDAVTDDASIDEELRMESVAFVELQVSLEDDFGVEIDAVHVVELNRFGPIVDYVYDLASRPAA
jgi:acyl carrier protein